MSKTIRRKNVTYDHDEILTKWDQNGKKYQARGKEKLSILARYHSDSFNYQYLSGRVPKWYHRMLKKSHKAKDRQVLRSINQGNYDNYSFVLWKHDDGYDYW